MNRRSVVFMGLVVLLALALVGCNLIGVVGSGTESLRIQGTVVDGENVGVENVAILLDSKVAAITGPNGTWEYAKTKKGAKVTAQKSGWDFDPESTTVVRDEQTILLVGTKQEVGSYSVGGKVLSHGGLPIEGARVSFLDEHGKIQLVLSGEDGSFSKSALTGEVSVQASLDGWNFIPSTLVVTGGDSNLNFYGAPDKAATYQASGVILVSDSASSEDGQPLNAVLLTFEFLDFADEEVLSTVSAVDGMWMMDGLLGRVKIVPEKDNYSFTPEYQIIDREMQYMGFVAYYEGKS